MMATLSLDAALTLPCGARIKNRLLKSAMSEQLGDGRNDPTPGLATLYRTWADGGIGVQVTGNVMVDRTALGEPANVVLDDASDRGAFRRWAEAGAAQGAHVWMQLNHPGKQSPSILSRRPVAPSAVPLAVCPDLPNRLLRDEATALPTPRPSTGFKAVDRATMLDVTYYEALIARIAQG